jgi:hypothetical protein
MPGGDFIPICLNSCDKHWLSFPYSFRFQVLLKQSRLVRLSGLIRNRDIGSDGILHDALFLAFGNQDNREVELQVFVSLRRFDTRWPAYFLPGRCIKGFLIKSSAHVSIAEVDTDILSAPKRGYELSRSFHYLHKGCVHWSFV